VHDRSFWRSNEYIEQRNPAAAARVGARIREAAEVLRYFPYQVAPAAHPEHQSG